MSSHCLNSSCFHYQGNKCNKCGKRWLSTVQRIPADIVVASDGGYPLDQDLYQCAKGVATAAECVKPGGVIIMVASCIDGVGGGDGFYN